MVVDNVAVNDCTEFEEVIEQPVEDVAVDSPEVDPPEVNTATQWLPVEDVLEEMRREEELNAPEEPPHNGGTDSDDLDGWSSPTIPSTDDDVGNHLDGQYNPYTSSEDSMYVEEQNYRSSSSSYQADESADESSESESATKTFREKGDKYKTPQGLTPLEWMGRRNIQSWCKYFFDTSTISEHSLNNHCESFNKWLLDAREMPILSCLETIRFKMMKRIQENYVGMGSRDPESLCPNAYDVIKERKKHALSCITLNNEPVESYCNPCFKVSSYKLAYRNAIYPLNDSSQWPNSLGPTLRAPPIETPRSGVKQKKRRREHGEVTGSGVASTSATPATAQAAPEEVGASQQVVDDRAYVRVTRSNLNVSRGGRTG
ncbi:hypothetical protein LINPERHAP1_LOCUS20320 [Linum perenne]